MLTAGLNKDMIQGHSAPCRSCSCSIHTSPVATRRIRMVLWGRLPNTSSHDEMKRILASFSLSNELNGGSLVGRKMRRRGGNTRMGEILQKACIRYKPYIHTHRPCTRHFGSSARLGVLEGRWIGSRRRSVHDRP